MGTHESPLSILKVSRKFTKKFNVLFYKYTPRQHICPQQDAFISILNIYMLDYSSSLTLFSPPFLDNI